MSTANPQPSLHPSIFVFRIGQVRAFLEDLPPNCFDRIYDEKDIGPAGWRKIPDAIRTLETAVDNLKTKAKGISVNNLLIGLQDEIQLAKDKTRAFWFPETVNETTTTTNVSPKVLSKRSSRESIEDWEDICELYNHIEDLRGNDECLSDDGNSDNSQQPTLLLDTSGYPTPDDIAELMERIRRRALEHLAPLFAKINQLVDQMHENYQCFYWLGKQLDEEIVRRSYQAPKVNQQFSNALETSASLHLLLKNCSIEVPGLLPILNEPFDDFSTSDELRDTSNRIEEILAQAPTLPPKPQLPKLHPYTMPLPKARNNDWAKHVKKFYPAVYERPIYGLKEREIEYLAYILYQNETVVTSEVISTFFRGRSKKSTSKYYTSVAISSIQRAIRDAFSIPDDFPLGKHRNGTTREIRIDKKLLSDRVIKILKEENSCNIPEIIVFKSHDDERT